MSNNIKDGTGKGYLAKVDGTNKVQTRSVTEPGNLEACVAGEAYVITSGTITLTSASESAVLYYQNDEDVDIILTRYNIGIKSTTSGTDTFATMTVYASNVTSMSDGSGNAALIVNSNIGSSKTLVTTNSERGIEGASINGTAGLNLFVPIERSTFITLNVVIPKGSAMGFSITPPTANTSIDVSLGLNVHKAQGEL